MKKGDRVLINGKEYTVDEVLRKTFIAFRGDKWDVFNKELVGSKYKLIKEDCENGLNAHNTGTGHKPINNDPLQKQEGGSHYKDCKIQPIEYITANNLDFMQGNIVKYITRHKNKNGAEDIKKIKHYCDLILKLEYNE